MEEVRGGAAIAGLPADAIGEEAFARGAFAMEESAGGDFRSLESTEKRERSMRFALWGRKRRDRELQEEIQAHLTLAEREEKESGRTRNEAAFAARREFGNVSVAEETTRDMWGWRWVVDFSQDFHYAVRTLRQRPGFAAVALLTLALGVGATTVMSTLINGVLLKPLPYPQAERLVAVHGHSDTWNATIYGEQNVAYQDFLDCQRESGALDLAAALYTGGTVSEPGEPEYVDLREISATLFSVLRVH